MHIADGVLPVSVSLVSYAATAGGVWLSMRRISDFDLPKIAVVTSSFFVASLIHISLGTASVHLLLPGIVGALLGPAEAFLSVTVALFLQAVLFQFGGLTALGANAIMMGIPAVLCGFCFCRLQKKGSKIVVTGAIIGALGTTLAVLFLAGFLCLSGEMFWGVAKLAFIAHIPIIIVESIITAFTLKFISRVKPEMLSLGKATFKEKIY